MFLVASNGRSSFAKSIHRWLWVPARAEPVIGPAEGRTRWLGRDDELPVLIHRPALLDEGRHAFGAVLERKGGMKQIAFDVHSFRQPRLESTIDGFLRHS